MPETGDDQVPNQANTTKKRNERTEAKFFEDADRVIAQASDLGAEYNPPREIAEVANLKAKRDATAAARTAHQANLAAEESKRNQRENLYKSLNGDVTKLTDYAKAAGMSGNEIEALKAVSRDIKGRRASSARSNTSGENGGENNRVSVANLSYVTRADNYARFIEQYDALNIATDEDMYKAATHRAKLAALRQASGDVIETEADSNSSSEKLDRLTYTDADSLMNSCIAAKTYILAKYGKTGQPYKNIAKTRFVMPQRLK